MRGIDNPQSSLLCLRETETKDPDRAVMFYTQTDHTQIDIRSQRIPLSKNTIPYPDQGGVVRLTTLELSNELSLLSKE